MKAANTFSLLFAILVFACYVDVTVPEKSSTSTTDISSADSSFRSSSSQVIALQSSLSYEGQSYMTIKIGSQIWLAQNLNAVPKSGNWWCHGNLPERCALYGKLYDWEAAMNACPSDWKLPSKEDYEYLSDYLLGREDLLQSEAWWNATFAAFKYENNGDFSSSLGNEGHWWSSTESGNLAYYRYIVKGGKLEYNYKNKTRGLSVRCIKR